MSKIGHQRPAIHANGLKLVRLWIRYWHVFCPLRCGSVRRFQVSLSGAGIEDCEVTLMREMLDHPGDSLLVDFVLLFDYFICELCA